MGNKPATVVELLAEMAAMANWDWGERLNNDVNRLLSANLLSSSRVLSDYESEHGIQFSFRTRVSRSVSLPIAYLHALTGERFFNQFTAASNKPIPPRKARGAAAKRVRACQGDSDCIGEEGEYLLSDSLARVMSGQAPTTLPVDDAMQLLSSCDVCGAVELATIVIDVCIATILENSDYAAVRVCALPMLLWPTHVLPQLRTRGAACAPSEGSCAAHQLTHQTMCRQARFAAR